MRGAPITVKCDCGQIQYIPYGETWECPRCGRRYDTNQIPSEEYWGIMREMRRYRLRVLWVAAALGVGLALIFARIDRQQAIPLAIALMAFWLLVYMPRWRQKVRRRARNLPRWQLHPE